MSNPSLRKTGVRLGPKIYQEIEKTKCRPRPRLATGDGSEPRRGLGPTTTTSSEKGSKGPRRPHELGSLVLTTIARNTCGKKWTPDTTPDKWEKKGPCQRMTGGNTRKEELCGHDYEGKGAKKRFRTWKHWKQRYQTSEANWTAPPKSLWQKTTTSKDSIRKRKNSNKPTIDANSGYANLGVCGGGKEFSIVGPMQEGEGS